MSRQSMRENMDALISVQDADTFLDRPSPQSFGFEDYQAPPEPESKPFDPMQAVFDGITFVPRMLYGANQYAQDVVDDPDKLTYDLTDTSFEPYPKASELEAMNSGEIDYATANPALDSARSVMVGDWATGIASKFAPQLARQGVKHAPKAMDTVNRKLTGDLVGFDPVLRMKPKGGSGKTGLRTFDDLMAEANDVENLPYTLRRQSGLEVDPNFKPDPIQNNPDAFTLNQSGRSPVGMVQSNDVTPVSTIRPDKQSIYGEIREDVTTSIDPAGGSAITGLRGQKSAPWQSRPYDKGADDELNTALRPLVARSFALSGDRVAKLGEAGQESPPFYELNRSPQATKKFRELIQSSKDELGAVGSAVDVYDSYKGMRLFVSPTGNSGFAIKPDGDVISVFSQSSDPRGLGTQMTMLATQEGGRKLDAFDSFLPRGVYNKAGYEDTATLPWNDEYAPEGWPAEMGKPNVTAMTYKPHGDVRPYDAGKASMVNNYDDLLQSQEPEIFAPDMSAGVTRQLHHAVPRADKKGMRSTVKNPKRKSYEGIFKSTRQALDEGAEMIAPESPILHELFGVGRQDMDDLTRLSQEGHVNIDIPAHKTTGRGGQHVNDIMTPANEMRLQDTLALSASDPRFAGSYGWYYTHPLRQRFISELGKEIGEKKFDEFMKMGSALSSGSAVNQEIKRSSEAYRRSMQGDVDDFIYAGKDGREKLPEGYGHIYHNTAHKSQLETMRDTGKIYTPESILSAPKTPNYQYSKTGENLMYPTQDAHFVRGTGLADVRPTENTGSIGKTEVGATREWFNDRIAEPLGMKGSPAQALLWNALAPQTGVKTKVGKPYLELFADAVERESMKTGKTPQAVLTDFIQGKGRLATIFGAGYTGAQALEQEQQQSD